jgi:hypothetical protein
MTQEAFATVVDEQIRYCKDLLGLKGEEYDTSNNDRLHAFKSAAVIQHESQKQALSGMMAKHTVSIYDMCNEDTVFSKEKWIEKITDSINYLLILRAIIEEEENNG